MLDKLKKKGKDILESAGKKSKELLDASTIRNSSVSPEQVLSVVRAEFPEYKSKNTSRLGGLKIEMKKGLFTRLWITRGKGKERIYVVKGEEGCLVYLLTFGLAAIFNKAAEERPRILGILKTHLEESETGQDTQS